MVRQVPPSHRTRPRFPLWVDATAVLALALALFAAYVGVAHATVVVPETGTSAELNDRDTLYFAIHGAALAVAVAAGMAMGALVRRSVFGLGVLLFAVMLAVIVTAQVATFRLACEGHNDIVRHWQCSE